MPLTHYNCVRLALTSLGPMVLEVGFSGATTEDIRPTGTLSVSMEGCTGFGMPVVVEVEGRWVQLKSLERRVRKT